MSWIPLLKAIGLCLVSIIVEAISATKEGRKWFEHLHRPKYSFSLQVWYIVGAVYYLIFGTIAYRQFASGQKIMSATIIILFLVMIINSLSNFIIFKYQSTKWFYLIIYPFAISLAILIVLLLRTDVLSAGLAIIYFLWLFYDLYYGYHLWKLNDTQKV